ncbi:Uncharacterized protein GBIM_00619 [Gryllus bimaculatus]|nr:Uncharacterized protein GBIM_00619 [Gryllus bimaculatus]
MTRHGTALGRAELSRGDGCVEKPLSTLWKNYTGSSKPDVPMKLTVCNAGLKAVTKEHGLTEYWSHRITYCAAPSSFPRVFCWEQLQQRDERGGQQARRQAGDEEVQRLAERLAAAPCDDVRLPDSASGRDYQQVVTRLAEHQENMQGEQQVALGAHPERRSSLGAGRRGSLPKRISWGPDVEALREGGCAERLLVAGGVDDGRAAPDSDEAPAACRRCQSGRARARTAGRAGAHDALGSSFRPLADFREPFPSLPYECNAPAAAVLAQPPPQPPSPGAEVLVDCGPRRARARAAPRAGGRGPPAPAARPSCCAARTPSPPAASRRGPRARLAQRGGRPARGARRPGRPPRQDGRRRDNVSDERLPELIDNGNRRAGAAAEAAAWAAGAPRRATTASSALCRTPCPRRAACGCEARSAGRRQGRWWRAVAFGGHDCHRTRPRGAARNLC